MVIYRDGVEEHADAGSLKVSVSRDGHTVESYTVCGVPRFFVTLKDSWWCAHGSSVAEAVADALWKDPERRPSLESVRDGIRKDGKSRKITLAEFRLLTGACAEGCRIAMARAKVSGSPMTAFEIRDRVSREWGGKLIRVLGWGDE